MPTTLAANAIAGATRDGALRRDGERNPGREGDHERDLVRDAPQARHPELG